MRLSTAIRNAIADAIETTVGVSPTLQIRTGARPTNLTDADAGTLLVEISVPADWLEDASSGAKILAGTWSGTAVASGEPGHFRLFDSEDTIQIDGSITGSGEGGDMISEADSITSGQTVSISGFTLTAPNS